MTRTILLATTALLASNGLALAQSPAAPAAQPVADVEQQGVLTFEPAFFADARPNTALDMLNRLPGFSITDGDGSRGFEGAVGNVLFNGQRPASKSDTGSSVAGRTQAAQVERIELIRGGAAGINMQGYPIVANVILKNETSRQHVLSYNVTTFAGGQTLHGGQYTFTERRGDRNWSVQISDGVNMSDSGGPGRSIRTDADGVVLRDEAYDSRYGGGGNTVRGTYAGPLAGGRIDTTARLSVSDFAREEVLTSSTARRENLGDNDSKSGELGLTYTRPVVEKLTMESRFIHSFTEFENASVNRTSLAGVDQPEQVFAAEGTSSETILRGLLRQERSPTLTLEGGAEVAYNMLDTEQAFTIGGTDIPLPSATVKVEEVRGETFGQATWRARPTLMLEGGLRLEHSTLTQSGDAEQEKTLFYAKPRFQATWTPRPADQFRFRYELDLGQLNFGDFAASANLTDDDVFGGNVDLEPEQRWIAEAVYERRFWDEGVFSITLRHDEIEDVIDRIPLAGGLSATGNIGEGTLDRIAVSLVTPTDRLRVPGGRLTLKGQWDETEVTDPTTGEARPITRVRPRDWSIAFEQDIASLKSLWGFQYLSGFDEPTFDPDQRVDVHIRDYLIAYAEYKPSASLSVRAQVTVWDDFRVDRIVYADRVTRPTAFVENRTVDPRTFVRVTLRQTF